MSLPPDTLPARRPPLATVICGLLGVAAVSFACASAIHMGLTVTLGTVTIADPFPGAAIPEAILAVVLAVGAVTVLLRAPVRWAVALAATLFAFLVTVYGLTITVGAGRTADIAYHVSVLVLLGITGGLLLLPAGRRALAG